MSERLRSVILSSSLALGFVGATGCARWAGDYAGTYTNGSTSISTELSISGPDTALQLDVAEYTFQNEFPSEYTHVLIDGPCPLVSDGTTISVTSCALDPSSVYEETPLTEFDITTTDISAAQQLPTPPDITQITQIYWDHLDLYFSTEPSNLVAEPPLYLDRVVPPPATTGSNPKT